ncbi:MAG TPA: hypothetical protein VGD42_21605, partial [Lysobacter sp.]
EKVDEPEVVDPVPVPQDDPSAKQDESLIADSRPQAPASASADVPRTAGLFDALPPHVPAVETESREPAEAASVAAAQEDAPAVEAEEETPADAAAEAAHLPPQNDGERKQESGHA